MRDDDDVSNRYGDQLIMGDSKRGWGEKEEPDRRDTSRVIRAIRRLRDTSRLKFVTRQASTPEVWIDPAVNPNILPTTKQSVTASRRVDHRNVTSPPKSAGWTERPVEQDDPQRRPMRMPQRVESKRNDESVRSLEGTVACSPTAALEGHVSRSGADALAARVADGLVAARTEAIMRHDGIRTDIVYTDGSRSGKSKNPPEVPARYDGRQEPFSLVASKAACASSPVVAVRRRSQDRTKGDYVMRYDDGGGGTTIFTEMVSTTKPDSIYQDQSPMRRSQNRPIEKESHFEKLERSRSPDIRISGMHQHKRPSRPPEVRTSEMVSIDVRSPTEANKSVGQETRTGIQESRSVARDNRFSSHENRGGTQDIRSAGDIRSGGVDMRSGGGIDLRSGDMRSGCVDMRSGDMRSGDMRSGEARSGGGNQEIRSNGHEIRFGSGQVIRSGEDLAKHHPVDRKRSGEERISSRAVEADLRELYSEVVCILKKRLYWVCGQQQSGTAGHSSHTRRGLSRYKIRIVNVDNELQYEPFSEDFGPLNLSQTWKFCHLMNRILKDGSNTIVIHECSNDYRRKSNAVYLMASFLLVIRKYSVSSALAPFENVSVKPFRDAAYGPCTYKLTVGACIKGLAHAMRLGWFSYETFDVAEYDYYANVEHGDLNWVIPDKFVAFSGPTQQNMACPEGETVNIFGLPPERYVQIFKSLRVNLVIRLNKKQYNSDKFVRSGIQHRDLYFLDGSCPSRQIVRTFLNICESHVSGAIGVHCKAGLGRTGTLIGCYAIKHFAFTASSWIGWNRIARPGSVLGPQQFFLHEIQQELWESNPQLSPLIGDISPQFVGHKSPQLSTNQTASPFFDAPQPLAQSPATFLEETIDNSFLSPAEQRMAREGDFGQGERLVSAKRTSPSIRQRSSVTIQAADSPTRCQLSRVRSPLVVVSTGGKPTTGMVARR